MGFYDDRRVVGLRHKQRRNRALFRTVGYITSLIPAVLIALNFDAFRSYVLDAFGGVPIETVQQSRVSTPPPTQQPTRVVREKEVSQERRETQVRISTPTLRKSTRRETTPPPFVEDEQLPAKPRQPVQLLSPMPPTKEVKPDYTVTLDLGKRIQRLPIRSLAPGEDLLIRTTFAGSVQVSPDATGRIALQGPYNPRIELSINVLNETILVLEYLVDSEQGKALPLTSSNLGSIRRRIMRRGQRATGMLKGLEAEKVHLEAYLASSQAKLWTEKRDAQLRIKNLPKLIDAARVPVNQLTDELAAVERLIDMVDSVNGSTIDVFVELPAEQHP